MGEHLLATIIELEKALQDEIRGEVARATAWRDRELGVLEHAVALERQRLKEEEDRALTAARMAVEREGARLVAAAESACARLAGLPDGVLEEMLRRATCQLLPEDDQ